MSLQASLHNKRINTKESVIDLSDYIDKKIRVSFVGGRQVTGILKGADPICNLVLDGAIEELYDLESNTEVTRNFGIMIARGTSV